MKTHSMQSARRFPLRILAYDYSYYIDRVAALERMLARKPRLVEIEMIGEGEIPADTSLLIRSVLMSRSTKTRLVTHARSSLRGGSVLVWLLGDTRIIREDARIYLRRADISGEEEQESADDGQESGSGYRDSYSEMDPEEADYARVLRLINEFLPVRELVGRAVEVPLLRQFGLLQSEKVDRFLALAFKKGREPQGSPRNEPKPTGFRRRVRPPPLRSLPG